MKYSVFFIERKPRFETISPEPNWAPLIFESHFEFRKDAVARMRKLQPEMSHYKLRVAEYVRKEKT